MREGQAEEAAGSPIGARLAAWRTRREMTTSDLAFRAGVAHDQLIGLEMGRDWVDRRSLLAALAGAMRLDVADLTGQPYPPTGGEHTSVRAVAFHLRRLLAEAPPAHPLPADTVDDLDDRTAAARDAEAAGDEHALALALPDLIRLADQVVAGDPAAGRERAARLRVSGYVAAAGLLRRIGYRDLAWMLLHRARPGTAEPLPVLVEEVRLLLDLGLPEYALARAMRAEDAGRHPDLPVLVAFAHAMAGRREEADRLLSAAERQAPDARHVAAVSAARAAVAIEHGAPDEAADHAHAAELGALERAGQVHLLMVTAAAEARRGRIGQAVSRLVTADELAPLRLRLDPFARELLSMLPARAAAADTEALSRIATHAGLR